MNLRSLFFTSFILLLVSSLYAQIDPDNFNPGLLEDNDKYNSLEVVPVLGSKSGELPLKSSLKEYCPPIKNQGIIGSCVGWSAGYGALTMMHAKRDSWSSTDIASNAFSAMYIYNGILATDNCLYGSSLYDAGIFLKESGNCKSRDFDSSPYADCKLKPSEEVKVKAQENKIKDYYALFHTEDSPKEKIYKTKKTIADGNPVVIGLSIKRNFAKLTSKYWDPSQGDTSPWGGHAMTVVGYDDARNAFELMNSWGSDWGNEGYIWIKYEDFGENCLYSYVYVIESEETEEDVEDFVEEVENDMPENTEFEEDETEEPVVVDTNDDVVIEEIIENDKKPIFMRGEFAFTIPEVIEGDDGEPVITFSESKPKYKKGYEYELEKKDWALSDQFQLMITQMQKSKYVYVFSIDGEGLNVHWPRNEKLSTKYLGSGEAPIIASEDVEIVMPSKESAFVKRASGNDNMIIIYAHEKIEDFKDRVDKVYAATGEISERYSVGFGDISVSTKNIRYAANSMRFVSSNKEDKTVVPIILVVEGE